MDRQEKMASPVFPAPKENQLKRESRVTAASVENPVLLARQEKGVHLVFQGMHGQDSKERRAVKGDKAPQELLDFPVQKVSQVKVQAYLALRVYLELKENLAYLDLKVTVVCRETLGCQVSQDKRVNMELLELGFQAQLARKESVECLELQVYEEIQEEQGKMAKLDNLVHLDKRVTQDEVFQAQKVLRVFQELQVSQEKRVALDYLVFLDEKVLRDNQALRA